MTYRGNPPSGLPYQPGRGDPLVAALAMVQAGLLSQAAMRAIAYFSEHAGETPMVTCHWDSAKAWIDGDLPEDDADEDATIVIPSYADDEGVTHPGWAREVEIAPGQAITYTAHAATDPTTVAALDELARAAYAQFASGHTAEQTIGPEEAWQFEVSSNGGAMGTLTVERESGRWASTVNAQTSTVWLESRAYDATFTGLDDSTWRTIITATDLAWLRRAAKRQANKDAERDVEREARS